MRDRLTVLDDVGDDVLSEVAAGSRLGRIAPSCSIKNLVLKT